MKLKTFSVKLITLEMAARNRKLLYIDRRPLSFVHHIQRTLVALVL
jgi:hypothetical protein